MNSFSQFIQQIHLRDRYLIEASAGTGKTYNIANIYLRLLLEGESPLSVDQILVVTFTRAATNELRGRIRDKIDLALQMFRQSAENLYADAFIQSLLEKYPNREQRAEICQRLDTALVCMDEACIFTIHSFAVQVIGTFLFETGSLAEVDLTEGDNHRQQQLLADLWRYLQWSGDECLGAYVRAANFSDLESFCRYFSRIPMQAEVLPVFDVGNPPGPLRDFLPQLDHALAAATRPLQEIRNRLRQRWENLCNNEGEIALKTELGDSGRSSLFKKITELLQSDELDLSLPSGQMGIRLQSLCDSNKPTALALFSRELVEHIHAGISRQALMKKILCSLLVQWLQSALSQPQLASMQLDDVIRLINHTLQKDNQASRALRNIITSNYPVCLVDEFQDTDPEQFELFNRLYAGSDHAGFFMIGDPKQSIYAFRGADIFSYLAVRTRVPASHIFSLDTNFRSKQQLVHVANVLFEDKHGLPTFLYEGMEYHPVYSCEAPPHYVNKGEYRLRQPAVGSDKPMVFVGNPENSEELTNILTKSTLLRRYARDTAQRISVLLHPLAGAVITAAETTRCLRAGEIAILVRSGAEARVMREELLKQDPPILSVYQSQRDSVFSSALFSEDLYHILSAMEQPKNKRLLKAAIATPLYRGLAEDFSYLDAIQESDIDYENCIVEFENYGRVWQQHGVLAALGEFMQKRQLAKYFSARVDADRLVTDFRHLGELLQNQAQQCSSMEELLIWYARNLHDDSQLDEDHKRIRLESDENLVKIVTIHAAKGLQYPVVFLPFFFFSQEPDLKKSLPFIHGKSVDPQTNYARVDFDSSEEVIEKIMARESCAEEIRLLYVAVTRAIYQCYIGISASEYGKTKKPLFPLTVWAHLLGISDTSPSWGLIRSVLESKFSSCAGAVAYQQLGDVTVNDLPALNMGNNNKPEKLMENIILPPLSPSSWIITSYSALAHARRDPGFRHGASDELPVIASISGMDETFDAGQDWQNNIRFSLRSGSTTGDCLHAIYENLAGPEEVTLLEEVQAQLQRYGLSNPETGFALPLPEKQDLFIQRCQQVSEWITQTLDVPLSGASSIFSLRQLYMQRQILPELAFDFSLGTVRPASIRNDINVLLQSLGVAGVNLPGQENLEGLMTGSMDLLFIHQRKVYVLDYKSNTLGKAPHYYDQANMAQAMKDHRYDLQYLIYSVAAHRYMQQRLGESYYFDGGDNEQSYGFGGVFYLFLRGMGIKNYPRHGIWFHRPEENTILTLDAAFKGERVGA